MGRHMRFVNPSVILLCVDGDTLTRMPFISSSLFAIRMVDDLHRLVQAAEIATPFILVGAELGALNSRFYTHVYDT